MQAQDSSSSIGLLSQSEIERILMLSIDASCRFEISKTNEQNWNSVKSTTVPYILQIRSNYILQWDSTHQNLIGGRKLCYRQKIKFTLPQNNSQGHLAQGNNKPGYEFVLEDVRTMPGENQAEDFFVNQDSKSMTFFTNDFQVEVFLGILGKRPIIKEIQKLQYVFKPGKIIYSCNSSKIYEASEISSKKNVAIKAYPKEIFYDSDYFEKIRQKILLLHSLKHQNILSMDQVYCTKKSLYIEMEICETSLEKIIEQKLSISSIKKLQSIIHQLFRGVSYLHSCHITHGNITSGNVLLKNLNSNQIRVMLTGFSHFRCYNLESNLIKNPENYLDLQLEIEHDAAYEDSERRKDMTHIGVILSNLYMNAQYRLFIAKQTRERDCNKNWFEKNKEQGDQKFNNWIDMANQFLERIMTSDFKYQLTAQQAVNHKLFSLDFNQ